MWQRLFGKNRKPLIEGDSEYRLKVAGTSLRQRQLNRICGGKTYDGHELFRWAVLKPEPRNRKDPNAIKVIIRGSRIGYVDRKTARTLSEVLNGRKARVRSIIVGGWKRGGEDEGSFGVRLDIPRNISKLKLP